MAMTVSRRDIDRAHAMVRTQQMRAERDQARKEAYMGQILQTAEVGAGALASGVLSGRYGALSLGPVPLDLLAGLGLNALGYMGVLGKYSNDVHNIGDGVLAAYLVKLGAGLGTTWRLRAGLSPFTTSGADPSAFGYTDPNLLNYPYAPSAQYVPGYGYQGGLTEADLAAMAAVG